MPLGNFLTGAAETWQVARKTRPVPKKADMMVGTSRETEGMGSSTEEPEMGTKSYGESEVVGMLLPLPQPRPARTF